MRGNAMVVTPEIPEINPMRVTPRSQARLARVQQQQQHQRVLTGVPAAVHS